MDFFLNGGLVAGDIVEVAGRTASGKTQLCMTLAVAVASQGLPVLYIDSGDASASRMLDIAESRDLDPAAILSLIRCQPAFAPDELLQLLQSPFWRQPCISRPANTGGSEARSGGEEEENYEASLEEPPRFVIIDSLASILAPSIGGQHTQGKSSSFVHFRLVMCLLQLS